MKHISITSFLFLLSFICVASEGGVSGFCPVRDLSQRSLAMIADFLSPQEAFGFLVNSSKGYKVFLSVYKKSCALGVARPCVMQPPEIKSGRIWSMVCTKKGHLVAGSSNGYVYVYDPSQEKGKQFLHRLCVNSSTGEDFKRVSCLALASNGTDIVTSGERPLRLKWIDPLNKDDPFVRAISFTIPRNVLAQKIVVVRPGVIAISYCKARSFIDIVRFNPNFNNPRVTLDRLHEASGFTSMCSLQGGFLATISLNSFSNKKSIKIHGFTGEEGSCLQEFETEDLFLDSIDGGVCLGHFSKKERHLLGLKRNRSGVFQKTPIATIPFKGDFIGCAPDGTIVSNDNGCIRIYTSGGKKYTIPGAQGLSVMTVDPSCRELYMAGVPSVRSYPLPGSIASIINGSTATVRSAANKLYKEKLCQWKQLQESSKNEGKVRKPNAKTYFAIRKEIQALISAKHGSKFGKVLLPSLPRIQKLKRPKKKKGTSKSLASKKRSRVDQDSKKE